MTDSDNMLRDAIVDLEQMMRDNNYGKIKDRLLDIAKKLPKEDLAWFLITTSHPLVGPGAKQHVKAYLME